ncbi:MAG: LamG domain-containing protein [Labilithrix sp.]|nr:LamG domain-containing protein [Labilithrix sp.]MCW5809774.1 LamG domain-containing protein [Labilithrix sp.]
MVGTSNVATGQWVHVAVTRVKSTGTVTLFVNGVVDGTPSGMSTTSLTANPNMDIGANFGNAHFFEGSIDEVRAWNVVRTAAEIQATMGKPLTGNEPGLVGYWRFDEESGPNVLDISARHADGTLGDGDAGTQPVRIPSTAF